MLPRQGHAVNYDGMCCMESVIASQVMSQICEEGEAYLPSNIFPGILSHAVMDSFDINKNTRSWRGTTHVLGSLIFQNGRCQTFPRQPVLTYRQDRRRNSVKHFRNHCIIGMLKQT